MRQTIETNPRFVLRLEDFMYASLIVYFLLFGTFVHQVIKFNVTKHSTIPTTFMICLIGACLVVPTLLIFLSYRKRRRTQYYLEDESIIGERNGRECFRIPFKEIVSVRVYNKRGKQGSIIFYTNLSSKNYSFSYLPIANPMPLSLYGLTRKKINLAKDRKQLLTAIYQVNPKLYFIE